jgi:hypothetical protein
MIKVTFKEIFILYIYMFSSNSFTNIHKGGGGGVSNIRDVVNKT